MLDLKLIVQGWQVDPSRNLHSSFVFQKSDTVDFTFFFFLTKCPIIGGVEVLITYSTLSLIINNSTIHMEVGFYNDSQYNG